MTRWTRVATAGAVALTCGCYTYRTTPIEAAPVGTSVRARLSPDEAARVSEVLGREDRTVEGEVMERTADGDLVLRVSSGTASDASAFGATHQVMRLPHAGLQELEVRQLDRPRTVGVVAIAAAAIAVAAATAFHAQTQPDQGPGRGGTNSVRVPLIGFRLPFAMPGLH